MVTCSGCEAKVFIPGDLPPLATEPCKRCGHPIMMPMQLRQFELRSKIASGGHGKVYRAFDNVLERMVAVKLMRKELENDPVLRLIWRGEARTLHEAEEQYLNASMPAILDLFAGDLPNDELCYHPLLKLLRSHGSRGREDSLL